MRYINALLLSLLVLSCKEDILLIQKPEDHSSIQLQFRKIEFVQPSYDTLVVANKENLVLSSVLVRLVVLEKKASDGTIVMRDSTTPLYAPEGDNVKLLFHFNVPITKREIFDTLTLRYIMMDSSVVEVDTIAPVFKYPYRSAEIFLREPGGAYQDFDLSDSVVFLHPYGPEGLYSYDLQTGTLQEVLRYGGGDYIARDSVFVFCDIYHNSISRYNVRTDSVDKRIEVLQYIHDYIGGLEVWNDTLFMLTDKNTLEKFTLDLEHLGTIPYSRRTFGITIYSGILYSNNYADQTISRYELSSGRYLYDVKYPSKDTDAIKIRNRMFYFTDFSKDFIGRLPVTDLRAPSDVAMK